METFILNHFLNFFLEKGILAHNLIGTYTLNKRLQHSAYSKFFYKVFFLCIINFFSHFIQQLSF